MSVRTTVATGMLGLLCLLGCQRTAAAPTAASTTYRAVEHAPAPAPAPDAGTDAGHAALDCGGLEPAQCAATAGCEYQDRCCAGRCLPAGQACPAPCPSTSCSDKGPPPLCASKGGCVVPVECVDGEWVCGPATACDR